MKISVCMIVRNEAKHLPNILPNIVKFADEIIIVDTGSTDETISIARMFTDLVYTFSWCNNFSSARNFSFTKANCDYIMWLDADDYIDDDNIKKINQLKKVSNPADVYMMKYATAFDEKQNPTFVFYRERLLRKSCNIVWSGFVHEAITPSGVIQKVDITIQHRKIGKSNPKRNLNLYRYHLKLGTKFSAREQYYYAKELYYNGYYTSAIRELKKYLHYKDKFLANHYDAVLTLSRIYSHMSKHQLCVNTILDFCKHHTPNSELCCELGLALFNLGKITQAIMAYQSALNVTPNCVEGAFVENTYYYLVPHLQLVCLYYKKGNYELAKYHHNVLVSQYPAHPSVIYNQKFFD